MSQNGWDKAEGKEMLVRMNGLWRKKCGIGGVGGSKSNLVGNV